MLEKSPLAGTQMRMNDNVIHMDKDQSYTISRGRKNEAGEDP